MKYDVTAIWTRTFTKTIEIEAVDEATAESQVIASLEASLKANGEDQSTWDLDSEDIDIESVDEGEGEGEGEVVS